VNGSALIAAVRTSTLIPTTQVSDDDLLNWLNEGYYRLAAMFNWSWLEASGHVDTVVGQQAYVLSTALDVSVRRIVAVYDDAGRTRLRQLDAGQAVEMYGDDWPTGERATCFFLWAGSLYLIPVPTTIKIYKVLYHKTPTALTAGSGPEFDPMFHHCLVHYGEFRAWQREEDLDKAAASYSHYADMVERMRLWYTQRVDEHPWAVGRPDGGGRWSNMPFLDGL